MRCSACFADITSPKEALCCVVCKLFFHIRCTSWKNLDYNVAMRLKGSWHCIFCRKNQIKRVLFVVDDTSIGIRQEDYAKRTSRLSTKSFERKMMSFQKLNLNSTFILADMLKSLNELKASVGSLSAFNMQCACDNVKLQKIIGDMNFKLENLCLI